MEKYILILSFILVVCVTLNAEANDRLLASVIECKVQEHATDDDVKNLVDRNQPRNREMKCLITCMGEKFGKIVNNKLNPVVVMKWFRSSPKYTEELEKSVSEIVVECKDVEDSDRCESGAKIADCVVEGAEKRGLKPEDLH